MKYAKDKPKDCKYCYFFDPQEKECELSKEHCYYLLPKKAVKKEVNRCDSCNYGKQKRCVGYCIAEIAAEGRKNRARSI